MAVGGDRTEGDRRSIGGGALMREKSATERRGERTAERWHGGKKVGGGVEPETLCLL